MKTDSIKTIKDFKSLAHFLADELLWPIDPENVDVDDLVFEYQPEDIGLSDEFAAKVQAIKQIRPLDANQPWSIFWIDFENKKLPLTVLRRILNVFVTKKRGNTRNIATKEMEDIMFVSGHGEDKNRAITFAHFKRLDDVETIREFYWDGHETKFDHISSYLEKLEWPSNTSDVEGWRKSWKAAFTGSTREAITTSDQLARAMANIAKSIRDRVLEVLEVEHVNGPVHKLYDTFRTGLVHDMTEKGFADMYAQTITYGLFSARTMDTDGHFELHEVIDLIPTTNPFLKSLFKECLSTGDKKHKIDLDELGVGRLVDLFDNLNRSDGTDAMQRILAEFGRQTFSGQEDPVIHFYEGFLMEYDSLQRVEKGVYYTPDPVVKFIVRSVNEQLKSEFGLEYGLADTTSWAEMVASGRADYPVDPNTGKVNKEWTEKIKGRAFVQILDPATGTGTFLKHVIEVIHEEVKLKFKKEQINGPWEDYWNSYVYSSLLPRIYGFELMMASYSVAHMKLGMFLKSTGYKFEKEQRLNIYLTNSLEPYTSNNSANLFFTSVGAESTGANDVKMNRFFSVVIGNPPYSGESKNKGDWIMNLMDDYKKEPGGKERLKERNPKWINDDYVKFLRLGQDLIEKNTQGVIAYINPHGFIDNPTFRGMRWSILKAFESVKIIDLHGNSRKKETALDGTIDSNVFDIMQGVSINFFIKTFKYQLSDIAKVEHFDLYGKREHKYNFLNENICNKINFQLVKNAQPDFLFIPKNYNEQLNYNSFICINEIFPSYKLGIFTHRDHFLVDIDKAALLNRINDFRELTTDQVRIKYGLVSTRDWALERAHETIKKEDIIIEKYSYRIFDTRYICYNQCMFDRGCSRIELMSALTRDGELALNTSRNVQKQGDFTDIFMSNNLTDSHYCTGGNYTFPLRVIRNNADLFNETDSNYFLNINNEIVSNIEKKINIKFNDQINNTEKRYEYDCLIDYVYSVLHSLKYREKYKDFLKIDFPRVPYPKDRNTFLLLTTLGNELRQIHLLESTSVNNFITTFPIAGLNDIPKAPEYQNNRVYINKTQFFDGVSEIAWNFYIGGYKPAQKWLKDRKGRTLTDEDIKHYQRIIVALTETDRIMKEIDEIDFIENAPILEYPDQENHFSIAADSGNE
jgi:predicted helicase